MTDAATDPAKLLEGQVALVTGASSGLGLNFARVLARHGAKVAIAARRIEKLDAVAEAIRADGGTVEAFALDVADAGSLEDAIARVEDRLGIVRILINNAGVPDAQLATKMPLDLIDQVINVNLRAPFILSREVARRLIKAKLPGRIVNLSSIGAYQYARPGAALYSTVKAGVSRMTETLAVEWAPFHINVNAIAPGFFDSEMMDGMRARIGDDFIKAFPRGRLGTPEQMDSTLLYLVSPASEAVTGIIIKVDDGQTAR